MRESVGWLMVLALDWAKRSGRSRRVAAGEEAGVALYGVVAAGLIWGQPSWSHEPGGLARGR